MENSNSADYLNKIKIQVIENLSRTKFAPSAQMQDVPRDPEGFDDEADAELDDLDDDEGKDVRHTARRWDKYVERDDELSESEDEAENARNGVLRQPGMGKRRNIMDYQNPNAVEDMMTPPPADRLAGIVAENGARSDVSQASSENEDGEPGEQGELGEVNGQGERSELGAIDDEDDLDMEGEANAATTLASMPGTPGRALEVGQQSASAAAAAGDVDMMDSEAAAAKEEGRAERIEDDDADD